MQTKRFQRVYIEIGNICNLQCSFCPEVEREKFRMQAEQLKKLLPQVRPLADQVCFHVMGEPLAHPNFSEFIEIAKSLDVPVEITTNGTLLNEQLEKALLNPIVRQINFSLQSFFDNFPHANPDSYLSKIFRFIKSAMKQRPELYLNLRLWNLDAGDLKDELNTELLKRIEMEFGIFINPNIDLRLRKSKNLIGRLYLHYDSRFDWPNPKDPVLRSRGTCHGTRSHIAIHANGTVVPCCLDKEAQINLGNVWESSFESIVNSERTEAMKTGFERKELVEDLCKKCKFATRFPV